MKLATLTICALLSLSLTLAARPQKSMQPTPRRVAMQWLTLVDNGRYGASWDQASKTFQSKVAKVEWIDGMKRISALYGKVLSRKFQNVTLYVPALGSGDHETFDFTINLARRGQATEFVSMIRGNDGGWRVSGYYIVPLNLFSE